MSRNVSGGYGLSRSAKRNINYDTDSEGPISRATSADPGVGDDDDGEEEDVEGEEEDAEGESEYESADDKVRFAPSSDAMDVDDVDEDAIGEDEEGDEDDNQPLHLPHSVSHQAQPQQPQQKVQTQPMKIKFKLSSGSGSSSTTTPPSTGNSSNSRNSRNSALSNSASTSNRPKTTSRAAAQKSKSRIKRVAEEEEEGDSMDELLLQDDDGNDEDGVGDAEVDELDEEGEDGEREVYGDGEEVDQLAGDDGIDSDDEMLGREGGREVSPSKLTARQRARGNQDLQETLLALPMDPGNKKLVLTEAEKLQRREETARKRKRQSEQKIQDEMDTTINRLLRAQTSRSRSKLDNPSPSEDPGTANTSSRTSPTRHSSRNKPPVENMIRWTSSIKDDSVVVRVSVPKGKEGWIDLVPIDDIARRDGNGTIRPPSDRLQSKGQAEGKKRDVSGLCAIEGCGEKRKYRSVKQFEIGGCCLSHLKEVEAGLS